MPRAGETAGTGRSTPSELPRGHPSSSRHLFVSALLNTLLAYEHVLGPFAVEHADLELVDLEPPRGGGVVRAFLDRHWQNKSAATRTQRLAIMRRFLAWLVGEGLLRANPAQNIRASKVKRKAREALSCENMDALIAAQPSLRDQAALKLLAYLGLRKGLHDPRAVGVAGRARRERTTCASTLAMPSASLSRPGWR